MFLGKIICRSETVAAPAASTAGGPTPAGAAQAGANLMVPDTACWAVLTTSGRLLRTADEEQLLGSLGPDLLDPAWDEDPTLRERALANLAAFFKGDAPPDRVA